MITSVQNNKVKQWNKLNQKKEREKSGVFLVEGFHLVEEAERSDWSIKEIIVTENLEGQDWLDNYPVYTVSDHVFKSITNTKTPQGIAAVIEIRGQKWLNFKKLLLIDAVQDPGNFGTMIRTADAAGFDAVLAGEGTVDLYNEKVIRATQGSLFHLPVFQLDLLEKLPGLKEEGFEIWASSLNKAQPYPSLSVPEKIALIVGNEGSGIESTIIEQADKSVRIPIYGQAESLNVSIAAGILLYHIANDSK